eukprot:TRINITY_DN36282_c0_g1_i3.p2 TRINITY_DN36282_c0_g1~~TRINITY_DN36282_c0_g1_i3.p2  ORF type:complete len:111 (-),score=10.26 TRINITY_DN36282_c0_g1_i3:403-735(-)
MVSCTELVGECLDRNPLLTLRDLQEQLHNCINARVDTSTISWHLNGVFTLTTVRLVSENTNSDRNKEMRKLYVEEVVKDTSESAKAVTFTMYDLLQGRRVLRMVYHGRRR